MADYSKPKAATKPVATKSVRSVTLPAYDNFGDAVQDGTVVVVEDADTHHTRLRARRAFYFLPLKSAYSDGEVIQWSRLETQSGRDYREAQERLAFLRLLAELTKCPTCGIYDCTQHGNPTSQELVNDLAKHDFVATTDMLKSAKIKPNDPVSNLEGRDGDSK